MGKRKTGIKITGKGLAEIHDDLRELVNLEVLVGFPEDKNIPRDDPKEPTNAQLAFIHDNGAPEANIPARPFMKPGVESVAFKLANKLGETVRGVLSHKAFALENGLMQAGIIAVLGIQNKITSGIPPPLADATLRARVAKGIAPKGALRELDRRWDGQKPSTEFAKTLVATGEMRKAVTYVIRRRRRPRNI